MDNALAAQLLTAIEANRLIALCGAGLSLAAPSNLPSARRLAEECADKYKQITGNDLPADHRGDLEKQARFFNDTHELQATFLNTIVNWSLFNGVPNPGHDAVADFLACKAISVGVTTNFDVLVESAARRLGEPDFRAWVEAEDINRNGAHAPLLKIHGCMDRSRWHTVWCVEQLAEDPLLTRLGHFRDWLRPQISQRDILLIGFWSDWAYLNAVFSDAVVGSEPRTIILVDPANPAILQAKAPELWAWAHSGQIRFVHVQQKGEIFLDEFRRHFSTRFLNRVIDSARPEFIDRFGPCDATLGVIPETLATIELYSLRRSFCGQSNTEPVRNNRPDASHSLVGIVHLLLFKNGATLANGHYEVAGRLIRIANTNGQLLSSARKRFESEPPAIPIARTICVGATDDGGVPTSIVRGMGTAGIVRGGTSGEWITAGTLFVENGGRP